MVVMAALFTAYALADMLHDRPICEALLDRDLLRGQPLLAEGGQATVFEVPSRDIVLRAGDRLTAIMAALSGRQHRDPQARSGLSWSAGGCPA